MADLKFEITKHLGIIKEKKGGWTKELNIVSWYEGAPKYDIRDWSKDHQKMSKGATLTEEELIKLYYLIGELFFDKSVESPVETVGKISAADDNDSAINGSNEEMIDVNEEDSSPDSEDEDDFIEELTKIENAMNDK